MRLPLLGIWFYRTFDVQNFKRSPFQPPRPPIDATAELSIELTRWQHCQRLNVNRMQARTNAVHSVGRPKEEVACVPSADPAFFAFSARQFETIEVLPLVAPLSHGIGRRPARFYYVPDHRR